MDGVTIPNIEINSQVDKTILYALSTGNARPEIAQTLQMKQYKIDYRIQELMSETKTKNATHLVATALRLGWIE